MERLDCLERKLLRRMLGYFWPFACHNEELYSGVDVMYRRMTRGKFLHFSPPSELVAEKRLRFFGHIIRRPSDRLVQVALRSAPRRRRPPGRKTKFWAKVVKQLGR
ncbi:hypothetical protein RB195_021708 [Necator americanus]|uniref:Uncharacterized protein n=1 Tax=Necator americanus TaxID=51031 RepID=A0ABR1ECL0_NECAM